MIDKSGLWSFRVLGPLSVECAGKPVAISAPQEKALLATLVLNANRPVSMDRLIDELWGESPPPSAKVQIQGLISRLRRTLRPPRGDRRHSRIATEPLGYSLRAGDGELEDKCFADEVNAARQLLANGDTEAGAKLLHSALARWRGPALSDVPTRIARQAADRLEELRLAALEDRIEADLELGADRQVVPELRALVAKNPFRERPVGQLMTAQARSGQVADALRTYRDWQRNLVEELGVEPSSALRGLHAGILRAEPGLRPGTVAIRRPAVPQQLPADLANFTGRRELLDELAERLVTPSGNDAPRVLVITGGGGTGKTAFAVRLAHRVRAAYPDGQFFVRLRDTGEEPVTPVVVLSRILRSLSLPIDMIPDDPEECGALFRDLVAGRRLLLVLDDAADVRQVRPLIPAEAGCAVVVTCRQRLSGLEWGRPVELGPLTGTDAMALLATLVGEHRLAAEPRAAAEFVSHCQGLPLALRIVGTQLVDRPHWALADMAARMGAERTRLDWLQAGDCAVRTSFSLGYQRLDPEQRALFRRLGLLGGVPSFASWTAAAVLDADPAAAERLLDGLVAGHLIEPAGRSAGSPRYRLHDLLRLFAREIVERDDPEPQRRAAVTRALGGWLWLAEHVTSGLPGSLLTPGPGGAPRWPHRHRPERMPVDKALAWFDAELPALMAAVALATDSGMVELAWELAMACTSYFDHKGLYADWLRCHLRALPAARMAGSERGAAALLRGIGQVHIYQDNLAEAVQALEESHRLSERAGDRHGMARAIAGLGTVHRVRGDYRLAEARARAALTILDEVGDRHGAVQVRNGLARARIAQGQPRQAEALLDEAMRICAELDDDHRTANVLQAYGELRLYEGDSPAATTNLRRALELLESIQDERCTAETLLLLGHAYLMADDHATATRMLVTAAQRFVDVEQSSGEAACLRLLAQIDSREPQQVCG